MKRTTCIRWVCLLLPFAFVVVGTTGEAKAGTSASPIWLITENGTDKEVKWEDHVPNPRFAIYDSGTPEDQTDDLVLDKETGLVWERSPSAVHMPWDDARFLHCYDRSLGGRKGWRVPAVEELASLVDPSQDMPALPSGHPFINLDLGSAYWSSTIRFGGIAFNVVFWRSCCSIGDDFMSDVHPVWCARGGAGHQGR